jgi:hypothetical protein
MAEDYPYPLAYNTQIAGRYCCFNLGLYEPNSSRLCYRYRRAAGPGYRQYSTMGIFESGGGDQYPG